MNRNKNWVLDKSIQLSLSHSLTTLFFSVCWVDATIDTENPKKIKLNIIDTLYRQALKYSRTPNTVFSRNTLTHTHTSDNLNNSNRSSSSQAGPQL